MTASPYQDAIVMPNPLKQLHPLLAACLLLPAAATAQQSPAPRQSRDEAWWTGPIIANSAGTLPAGHFLIEPYLFDVTSSAGHSFGSLTYLLYGLTDQLTVGVMPSFGYNDAKGGAGDSSRIGPVTASAPAHTRRPCSSIRRATSGCQTDASCACA
jgi:hypothetical protein